MPGNGVGRPGVGVAALAVLVTLAPLGRSGGTPAAAQVQAPGRTLAPEAQAPGSPLPREDREARGVDPRLASRVTLGLKGSSLEELCAELEKQTGVRFRASRGVMDEKTTLFVREKPVREVMSAVAGLFGYFWARSGEEGSYRYELVPKLREEAAEQEMRDRDYKEALSALDRAMQAYTGYLDKPVDQLQELQRNARGAEGARLKGMVTHGSWGAVQAYRLLQPADFAALRVGETVRFGYREGERKLPAAWKESFLQSFDPSSPSVGKGARDPAALPWVELEVEHGDLGQLTLRGRVGFSIADGGSAFSHHLADVRSPATERPRNAESNRSLKAQPPFTRRVELAPKSSCPKAGLDGKPRPLQPPFRRDRIAEAPHVTSADVWEEVHRVTGLPVVADFYSQIYPLAAVSTPEAPLFEGLCRAADELRVRWRKEGDFLLCRSTSYFWDKLKEVPNRHLRRWQAARKKEGALPLSQVLEICGLSNAQLGSETVGRVVEHCWGISEWGIAGEGMRPEPESCLAANRFSRPYYRLLSLLEPAQLRRALDPAGLPVQGISTSLQGELEKLNVGLLASTLHVFYVPDGWYLWRPRFPASSELSRHQVYDKLPVIGAPTPTEALAAARRIFPGVQAGDIVPHTGSLSLRFLDPRGEYVVRHGMPEVSIE